MRGEGKASVLRVLAQLQHFREQGAMLTPFVALGARLVLPRDPGAFRLFLAGLVFVHHFSSFSLGGYAVYVFFVLSGFWVQRMWTERYALTRAPYATYLVSRVWRLVPVMALVSAFSLAVQPLVGMPPDWLAPDNPLHLAFSSVFLLGYAWLEMRPVGPAWSLDIEMQYYVLAPALALLAARIGPRVLLVLAANCTVVFAVVLFPSALVVLRYLGFFVAGLCAARLDWRPSPRMAGWCAGLAIAVVAAVIVSPWRSALLLGAHPGPYAWAMPPLNVALAVLTIPYAIFTTGRRSDGDDRMMADLSYIVYLLHWSGVIWFHHVTGGWPVRLAVVATCAVLVGAGSWLIWRFYDKPINRIRAHWVESRMAARIEPDDAPLAEPAGP